VRQVVIADGKVEFIPLPGMPEIREGDDLAGLIVEGVRRANEVLLDGDVVVVAQKVVSKAEGRRVRLSTVVPSEAARELAGKTHKDARKVELVLRESRGIVRVREGQDDREGVLVTEHRLGLVCANAGVDESNVGSEGGVLCLPEDPDASAERLRVHLHSAFRARLGVIITDTFGRAWRLGLVNVAIGLAGFPAVSCLIGERDRDGRALRVTQNAVADEVAAAAGLSMGKAQGRPAIVVRGLTWDSVGSCASDLLRAEQEDLFR